MSIESFRTLLIIAVIILVGTFLELEIKKRPPVSPCLEYGFQSHQVVHINPESKTLLYQCGGAK